MYTRDQGTQLHGDILKVFIYCTSVIHFVWSQKNKGRPLTLLTGSGKF